jgi:hypothetical protein
MTLREKFRKADKESLSSEDMANRCIAICDELLINFLEWMHNDSTHAVVPTDVLKLFKENYEKEK